MGIIQQLRCRLDLLQEARFSWDLLRDSVRMARSPYVASSRDGVRLELRPGQGEWFTFYENVIRQDYFKGAIPLKSGDCVIDIGANIGSFTVVAAQRVGPSGRVHSYEPDPLCVERLRHNVDLNRLSTVTVVGAAVGGAKGQAQLHRHHKSAFSSLFDGVDGRVRQHADAFDVEVHGVNEVIEHCGPLVQLMKVDCEGAEYDMFDAIRPEVAKRVRQIAMEVHAVPGKSTEALYERLQVLGFEVQQGYPWFATQREAVPA